MSRLSRYSPEVRERAVRLVREHGAEHPSEWAAIESIAGKLGCTAETLRKWVRQAERDNGLRGGLTTAERQRAKALEREVRELKRINEILRKASYFAHGARPPTAVMVQIDDHRDAYGVESCTVVPIAPSTTSGTRPATQIPRTERSPPRRRVGGRARLPTSRYTQGLAATATRRPPRHGGPPDASDGPLSEAVRG